MVVIETKRLDSNKPRFSYTGSLDLNMPDLSSYDLCNALEKLDVEFTEGVYDVNNPNDMKKYYALCKKALEGLDTYWLSQPVQFGYGHKHSLMIELGKDELRTSLNFSYSNNVGIMKKSGRENLSGAFNLQYNYKNKLRFQNQASFTQNKSEDTPYGSFSTYAVLNPYEDMYDENGLLAIQIGDRPNPYRDGEIGTSLTSSYRQFINNTSLEWTIIEGLRLRGKLGITVKNNDADQFYPASHSKFANYTGENAVRKGSYQVNNGKSSTLSGELLLNWYKQFNEKHNLFVNLGYNLSETISSEVINGSLPVRQHERHYVRHSIHERQAPIRDFPDQTRHRYPGHRFLYLSGQIPVRFHPSFQRFLHVWKRQALGYILEYGYRMEPPQGGFFEQCRMVKHAETARFHWNDG